MSELTNEELDHHLEEARTAVKTLESALSTLNRSGNQHLRELARRTGNDLKQAKQKLAYWRKLKEGPWMDKDGRIGRGSYSGLYIGPLLQAMAHSAKDFPTAMRMIADSVSDPDFVNQSYTMYPREDPKSKTAYGLLIEMAPNESWEKIIEDLHWDT